MVDWARILYGQRPAATSTTLAAAPPAHKFSTAIGSDYQTWTALVGNSYSAGRITRAQAMRVPALKAARDYFCSLATLPLHAISSSGEQIDRLLLNQPESIKGRVRVITMAKTIEDLFYEGLCLWLVIQRDSTGFPTSAERVEHGKWSQDEAGTIRVNDREIKDSREVILFESPNDPILEAAAPTVRMLLRLEATSEMYANQPEAHEYFTPAEGQVIEDPEDIQAFLDDWHSARRRNISAFLHAGVERHEVKRMTPEEMQLISAREFSISEISRLTGISPNALALNITSRTYSNMQDERRQWIEGAAAPYLAAIEQRLSLGDVTPGTQQVRWNYSGYLRADTEARYAAYSTSLAGAPFKTVNENRALENMPPIPGGDVLPEPAPNPGVPNA